VHSICFYTQVKFVTQVTRQLSSHFIEFCLLLLLYIFTFALLRQKDHDLPIKMLNINRPLA